MSSGLSAALRSVLAPADAPRLDRFLADSLPEWSRSRLRQLIEAGCVAVNGAPVRDPAASVTAGSHYTVRPPPPAPAVPAAQPIGLAILHEDRDLIVLNKPAGLVVHPAPGSPDGTLVNALLAHCGATLPGIGGEKRPGIVHRLDKDTSGVMVVAKSEPAMVRLAADFAAHRMDRAYLALAWGLMAPSSGALEGAIGRDPRDRKRMAVVRAGGKPALTRYATNQAWHGAVSLLTCRLETGRTHQIRVHLATAGHAVVGDPVYLRRVPAAAGLLPAAARAALLDFPRQALHAACLGFAHPITGARLMFETPPPPDMAALLAVLAKSGKS
jgi:23S rRNA pseudouridine1911/1915/1917 synthase